MSWITIIISSDPITPEYLNSMFIGMPININTKNKALSMAALIEQNIQRDPSDKNMLECRFLINIILSIFPFDILPDD